MAKASAPPTTAVSTPTFSVFQIDSMVSGLSNTLLKWTQLYWLMSNSASKSLKNRNLRNAATISASVGSTTTTNR